MAVILIGTSGYSYDDWRGPFYPEGLAKDRFLTFYAEHFPVCEINFTYYRPPDARTMAGMLHKSGGRVELVVKAPKELTHERVDDPVPAARGLVAALAPLRDAGVLGAVLLQFPFSFHATEANRDYLRRVRELMPDLPLVVEVRNARWISEATFDLLREHGLAFCNVDEPRLDGLLPRSAWSRPRRAMCASTAATPPSGGSTRRRTSDTTTATPTPSCASGCPACRA